MNNNAQPNLFSTTSNTPFFQEIASYYAEKVLDGTISFQDFAHYCFVFSNRRMGKFFEYYLALEFRKTTDNPFIMPKVTTITDFLSELTGCTTANPIESLFILYQSYVDVIEAKNNGQETPDVEFDKFIYWGNIVLSDFSDIDLAEVSADDIFGNIKDLRNISTEYLDESTRKILMNYLGYSLSSNNDDEKLFKNNSNDSEDNEIKERFYQLWEILGDLYKKFNKNIEAQGLSYKGLTYRKAVDVLKDSNADELTYNRYVFAGFNRLSKLDKKIFSSLQKKGIADFFWDNSAPFFDENKGIDNIGANTIKDNAKQFSQPFDFISTKIETTPNVTAVAIPSNVGQVKWVMNKVERMIDNGDIEVGDSENGSIKTAIVLPDESLLPTLIGSMPENQAKINITMGYQLRDSDIMSLMRMVAQLHKQARIDGNGNCTFFRDDVKNLLSHPIIKGYATTEALDLLENIERNNEFQISQAIFKGKSFETLFNPVIDEKDKSNILDYIDGLIAFVKQIYKVDADSEDDDANQAITLQKAFATQYITVLQQVHEAFEKYGIVSCENSVFYLIDRLAGMQMLPFQGEPLKGLQVMGYLETRGLDFDNVFILSANERILPQRHVSRSFINEFLRRAYQLSTIEDQEAITTYHFYRLIGRAKNVFMVYDSRTAGLSSGEASRYVRQLKLLYDIDVHSINVDVNPEISNEIEITAPYHPKMGTFFSPIVEVDNRSDQNTEKKIPELSASSINKYINCPLSFYFHYIQGLNDDNAPSDFMNSADFGTIVHDTLQELYYPNSTPQNVYKTSIEDFKKNKLDTELIKQICKTYLKTNPVAKKEDLKGDARFLFEPLKTFVTNVLDYDSELLRQADDYIEVLECEADHHLNGQNQMSVGFDGNPVKFNLSYKIDRIDRLHTTTSPGNVIRIIDYKTGKDKSSFSNWEADVFNPDNKERRKAILQLMLYCNAYYQEHKLENPEMVLEPIIYTIPNMSQSGVFISLKRGEKNQIKITFDSITPNGGEENEDFMKLMHATMAWMKDPNNGFKQCSEKSDHCKYCNYIDFCRRNSNE